MILYFITLTLAIIFLSNPLCKKTRSNVTEDNTISSNGINFDIFSIFNHFCVKKYDFGVKNKSLRVNNKIALIFFISGGHSYLFVAKVLLFGN